MKKARLERLYLFTFALHLACLWWLPFFPSQDGPSHVYNTVILHDLMSGGATYGSFFEATLFFTPNLGATVPLYLLTAFLPPVMAEKVFLSTFMVLLVWVMPKLARRTGTEAFPASFLVFPLLFSRLTLPGFYSFMLGVPLWLWATWLFWRMRSLPLWRRALAGNACALVLFACHLLPFGCYVLACACAALCCSPRRPWARLREAIVLLALPVLLLGAYSLTLLESARQSGIEPGPQTHVIDALAGLDLRQNMSVVFNLLTFEQVALSFRQFISGVVLGFLVLAALYQGGVRLWRTTSDATEGTSEHRLARRWMLLMVGGLLATMLCVPDRIGELSLIKLRFTSLVLLLVIPLLSGAAAPVSLQRLLLSVALTVALVNAVFLSSASYEVQAFVTSLPLDAARGRLVAGYRGSRADGPVDPMTHATSYYCARHGCVDVDNYQAHSQQFFVRFKDNPSAAVYRQLETAPTTIEWEKYPDIEYLLGWEFDAAERTRLMNTFTMLNEIGAVSLWHRRTAGAR